MDRIDPQSINLGLLPSLPLVERRQFPQVACIYFAIDSQDQIQYIGRSVNLKQRWTAHHRCNRLIEMEGIRIAWMAFSEPALLPEIETALIEWFLPPLNRAREAAHEVNHDLMRLRTKTGLTQKEVALTLGVTDKTVSGWELETRVLRLTPSQTLTLCKLLSCDLETLARITERAKK